MPNLLIINNIPTPYRTFLFNKMKEIGKRFGFGVCVAYQAQGEARRPWKPGDFHFTVSHYYSTGLGVQKRPVALFRYGTVNLDIIRDIRKGFFDYVLMSPFMSVTGWIASLLPTPTKKLLWSESNLLTSRHMSVISRGLKRALILRYDAAVCPGKRAFEYLRFISPSIEEKPRLWLPNLVDVNRYRNEVSVLQKRRAFLRLEAGISDETQVFLSIGRLSPTKGFHAILNALPKLKGGKFVFLLAGEGPERREYERINSQMELGGHFRMLGLQNENEILNWLACSDWFIHPARSDPSPLVLVEATVSGLPLAVSNRTGNAPECVEEGVNGFTFDPTDGDTVVACLQRMLSTRPEQRAVMGQASLRIARERFDPDSVLEKFFKQVLCLSG